MAILVGIAIVGILLIVHEYGHLLACQIRGVPAPVFSIGVGPTVWNKVHNGTDYRLAAIPLAGYVQYEPEDDTVDIDPVDRIVIYLGGPVANFVLAFALFCAIGQPQAFVNACGTMMDVLGNLFTGRLSLDRLSGPVGIVHIAGQSLADGWRSLTHFAAFLSLNLAVLNLLPLPVLDGGQILRAVIEWLTGKRLSMRWRIGMALATWGLLLGVLVYVTAFDIMRLFKAPPTA